MDGTEGLPELGPLLWDRLPHISPSCPPAVLRQNLFVNPVSPAMVADYEQWVPMEKQMWLNRIKERVSPTNQATCATAYGMQPWRGCYSVLQSAA